MVDCGLGHGKALGRRSFNSHRHPHPHNTAQMAQSSRHQTMITSGALSGAVVLPLLFALVVRVRLPLPLRVSLALLLGQIDAGRLLDDSL